MTGLKIAAAAIAVALAFALPALAADPPFCAEVQNDPGLSTCTCTCEQGSTFRACTTAAAGAEVPSPNSCPDMLQGQRVIARGDWLVVDNPFTVGSITRGNRKVYRTIGPPMSITIPGNPQATVQADYPCRTGRAVPFPQRTRMARLFNLPNAVMVTTLPNPNKVNTNCTSTGGPNMQIAVHDLVSSSSHTFSLPETWSPNWQQLAVADFDHDGFDDLFFMDPQNAIVSSASDPSDPSAGLVYGNKLHWADVRGPLNEPTTGDFNGDGILEVAWVGGNFGNSSANLTVFFVSVCPGDVADTICEGAARFDIIDNPAGLIFSGTTVRSEIVPGAVPQFLGNSRCSLSFADANTGIANTNFPTEFKNLKGHKRAAALVLGDFIDNGVSIRGTPIDELIVTYVAGGAATSSDPCLTNIDYWEFTDNPSLGQGGNSWARKRAGVTDLLPELNVARKFHTQGKDVFCPGIITLNAEAARLDWFGNLEQAVVSVSGVATTQAVVNIAMCPPATTYRFPVVVQMKGTDNPTMVACSASRNVTNNRAPPLLWGTAVGVFTDSTTVTNACSDYKNSAAGACPFNPEIAMLIANDDRNPGTGSSGTAPHVQLWSVNPSNLCPSFSQNINLTDWIKLDGSFDRAGSLVRAGDVNGTSVRVGPPTVVRVQGHTQPQIIVQAPPMHIGYVTPQGASDPEIVNMSVAPLNFFTRYSFETSEKQQAGTQQTTSWSTSTTETVGTDIKVKIPLAPQVDVKNKETWGQTHDSKVANQLGSYSVTNFDATKQTDFADEVWFTQTSFNIFHYPLIGQTACPQTITCDSSDPSDIACGRSDALSEVDLYCEGFTDSSPATGCRCLSASAMSASCTGDATSIPSTPGTFACSGVGDNLCCTLQEQQLNMTLSAPQETLREHTDASTLEWYQPRHQPGQIFSYPSSLAVAEARIPRLQNLTDPNAGGFTTENGLMTESTSWGGGASSMSSVASSTTHSFESDTSVSLGTPSLFEAGGATVTSGFDYNHSSANSTLNTYSIAQTTSTGIEVAVEEADFLDPPTYKYSVQPLIFGNFQSPDVLQDPPTKTCPEATPDCSEFTEAADIATTNGLTAAYTANPLEIGSGTWWAESDYTRHFDVALNHPVRWRKIDASDTQNPDLQCRGPNIQKACFTIRDTEPIGAPLSDVWVNNFYPMRGLSVTVGGTAGPQRNQASVGETVYLRARVNNFSLTEMDPDTQVFARFYRQQIAVNGVGGVAEYLADAEEIATVPVISPFDGSATVLPFNSTGDPDMDNISLATASFRADVADSYWIFWVLVWAEGGSGNLLPELPGYGLDPTFDKHRMYGEITDVPLETVMLSDGSLSTFSNNVGLFKSVFYVAGNALGAVVGLSPELFVEDLRVEPRQAAVGEEVSVSARVVSLGAIADGVTVLLSDGDRGEGGRTFDMEVLARIRADDAHFVNVPFRPSTCGRREIVVEALSSAGFGDRQSVFLTVPCKDGTVEICHKGTKTLSLAGAARDAHFAHGDLDGACN